MRFLQSENYKTNTLALLAVGTFGLNLFTLLLLMFHASMLQQLSDKNKTESLVQLADGSTITADPKDNLDRNPETIKRFVGETMTLMLTWSKIQSPQTVWQVSSELLANDLKQNGTKIIQLNNVNRKSDDVLVLQTISQPIKIGNGKWKVDMLANRLTFVGSDRLGKSIPFNKEIFVRVRDKPINSLSNASHDLNTAVAHLSEARLEIYNICDIKNTNCAEN